MGVINGNNLNIRFEQVELINCNDVSLNFTHSLVESTTKSTKGWLEFVKGVRSASGSFSGLVDYTNSAYNAFKDEIIAGLKVSYEMVAEDQLRFFGDAIIESFEESGGSDDVVTYSGSFTIIGDLQVEPVIPTEEAFLIDQNDDFITLNDEGDKIILEIPE